MNKTMMKFAFAAAVMTTAGGVVAQEFGAGKSATAAEAEVPAEPAKDFVQSPDGAMAQTQTYVEDFNRRADEVRKPTPEEEIGQYMIDEKIKPYDPATGRIVVQSTVTFDVRNPKVSTDFIGERVSRMMELLMNAKAEVVKTICTRMSAERVLSLPANPIRRQLEKEEKEIKKQIDYAKSLLDQAGVKVDEAKLDTKRLTIPELMAAITDVFKSDYAAKLDAEKKAEYELAKKDYDQLKLNYDALVERAKTLQSKMDDNLQKQSTSDIRLMSEMQIHGCTILDQAEGAFIRDGGWKYQISATFAWSEEAQRAAEAVLAGKKLKLKEGKHSVVDWLDHYAKVPADKGGLADWMGPRTYTDDNGDMWFLGIYAAPVLENAIDDEKAVKAAALMARAEVGYALYSDIVTENAYESLHLDVKVDGQTVSKKLEDYSEKTVESFKDLVLYGLGKVGPTFKLRHSTGHDIHVVVMGINASQAATMRSIHANAKNLAIRINTAQEFERGRNSRMREQINASKDNAAARDAGAAQADQETAEAFKQRAEAERQRQATSSGKVKQNPGLKQGVRFTRATDDF